jgi:hypothetical protein
MKGLFLWEYSLAMREASLANRSGLPKFEALFAPITSMNYFLVKM